MELIMMSTLGIITFILAVWFVGLGLSLAFNNKGFCKLLAEFADEHTLLWSWGLGVVACSLVILNLTGYTITWTGYTWIMPLVGWAGLIKGLWLTWWPQAGAKMIKTYCRSGSMTTFGGIIVILLGIFFWQIFVPMY